MISIAGVWQPGQNRFHETGKEAQVACADELSLRTEAITINLNRLALGPEEHDGIRMDGTAYKRVTATGLLKPLSTGTSSSAEEAFVKIVIAAMRQPPRTPVQPDVSAERAFADAVIACIEQAQINRATDPAATAGGLRLIIAHLSEQLAALESGSS